MAKRPDTPTWEQIEDSVQGQVDKWGNWLDELIGEGNEKNDRDFEVSLPRMEATTSSNPSKPRTLQAGYDYKTKTMTVVFRDGTWWEYKEVPVDMWSGFKVADSKGRYLRSSGLDSWGNMGPANIADMPRHRRVQMNNIKEFADYMYSSKTPEQ
jgi:hypothetical protein